MSPVNTQLLELVRDLNRCLMIINNFPFLPLSDGFISPPSHIWISDLTKSMIAFNLCFFPLWPDTQEEASQKEKFFPWLLVWGNVVHHHAGHDGKTAQAPGDGSRKLLAHIFMCHEEEQGWEQGPGYTQSLLLLHFTDQPPSTRAQFPKVLQHPHTSPPPGMQKHGSYCI